MNSALLLLLLFDGDGEIIQTGALVGEWSNVASLKLGAEIRELPISEQRPIIPCNRPRITIEAQHE